MANSKFTAATARIGRFICVAAIISLAAIRVLGQQAGDYAARIDSLVELRSPRTFNGVVVIAQKGRVKYARAHGYADLNKKEPLAVSARFSTMSVAKQVTALLILKEVEQGNIDLHLPIRKYLPELKYSWADTITMHHLLNHTSGLNSNDIDRPLRFATGTSFAYSNAGYSLAGQILERTTQKTFRELVAALFRKCGMKNSAYPTETGLLSKGHAVNAAGAVTVNEHMAFAPAHCFSSHLVVTAADLVKWNECLHGGKLLKPATYKLMTGYSVTDSHPVFGPSPLGYGYGLRINDKGGILEIGHTGYNPGAGFTAVNLYYPQSGISVIVLENQAYENFDIAYYYEQAVRRIVMESRLVRQD